MTAYSLYLHIPFCRHRCGYCDFNTYAGMDTLLPLYVQALGREAKAVTRSAGNRLPVHTIYLGGGTPSLVPLDEYAHLFDTLREAFDLFPGVEITIEANPGTVDLPYLGELRRFGVNRLSLGVQSAHVEELRLLERQHSFLDVIQAVESARQAGFDNLNLDLIFGLPGQTLELWEASLTRAVELGPEHLSLYALTIEPGTPLHNQLSRGLISEPDPDLVADMYERASDLLDRAGYIQYEISNWARDQFRSSDLEYRNSQFEIRNPSLACLHNLQYWRNLPYIGLGAGAHGYAAGTRTANVALPAEYIDRFSQAVEARPSLAFPRTPATSESNSIDRRNEIAETMMMGLRLTREGVSPSGFAVRFGEELQGLFAVQIAKLIENGLLEWAGEGREILRLTQRGRFLSNRVFVEFV